MKESNAQKLVKEIRDFRDSSVLPEREYEALTRMANALCHWPPDELMDYDIIVSEILGEDLDGV